MSKKRYAQIGVGSRSQMYSEALAGPFAEKNEAVALCDVNEGRLRKRADWFAGRGTTVKTYAAADFERMIAEVKPDCVIVTTPCGTHPQYICRAMELGCDVITEKAMAVNAADCQRIIDTQRTTGRKCTVTFNYRYSPPRTQIKDLLMSGIIGEVLSLDFHWLLDTRHGADYFRRWHRHKVNSGGLMVHKATHHFDLINWWLSTVPAAVYASGSRSFYTPRTAERYGLTKHGERCYGCPETTRCPFYLDITKGNLGNLYFENEKYDGYFRDRCVFSPDMDIEDSMNLAVNYENNVTMTYSLNAFMPWEGYMVYFNGTKGRLEHIAQETVYVSGDGSVPGALKKEGTRIRVFPHFKPAYEIDVWTGTGGHGGGDIVMLKEIFDPDGQTDKYLRGADQRGGAYSILTGIAANESMAQGTRIVVDDLVKNVGRPDYPVMPTSNDPIPLPW